MRELQAQAVLLARAFEETDAQGAVLRPRVRQEATETARAAGGPPEEQAARRAEILLGELETAVPGLATVRRATRVPLRVLLPLPAVALVAGALSNALGPERQINILSFPLLGIIAWNLLVYAGLVALLGRRGLRSRRSAEGEGAPQGAGEARWRGVLGSIASFFAEHALRRVRLPDAPRTSVSTLALRSYWRCWAPLAAPLVAARVRFTLHLSAALLGLGAVVGMYVRGLTFEYRATWESTFFDADVAAALLHAVLGPAAALLGVTLPDAAHIAAMRAPAGSDSAALWIHLWAITAGLVILVPRTLLALGAFARQRRLAGNLAVDPFAGSFRALHAPDRGAGLRVEVLPYSYGVSGREADTLRELLHDVFGLRADVRIQPVLPYGAEPQMGGDDDPACAVVVYGLVQSPEREVHGRFVEDVRARARNGTCVLAVVDSSRWHERFAGSGERREVERRRAWDRVLGEVGVSALHVNLARPLGEETVQQAEVRLARSGAR